MLLLLSWLMLTDVLHQMKLCQTSWTQLQGSHAPSEPDVVFVKLLEYYHFTLSTRSSLILPESVFILKCYSYYDSYYYYVSE